MKSWKQSWLVLSCLLAGSISAGVVAFAKDKEKEKPAREQPAAAKAPAANRAESNNNRGGSPKANDAPPKRAEPAPRVERRNDNPPPAANRPTPQPNVGNGPSKRDDSPRDNRGGNNAGQGADARSNQIPRVDLNRANANPAGQNDARNDRRDRNTPGAGNPSPSGNVGGIQPVAGLKDDKNKAEQRRDDRAERRDDPKPRPNAGGNQPAGSNVPRAGGNAGGNNIPKIGGGGNNPPVIPNAGGADNKNNREPRDRNNIPKNEPGRPNTNPGVGSKPVIPGVNLPGGSVGGNANKDGADNNKGRDRRDDNDKNRIPKLDGAKTDLGGNPRTPGLDPKGDRNKNTPTILGNGTVIGKDANRPRPTQVRVEKNGHAPKLDLQKPAVRDVKPEINEKLVKLRETKDQKEFHKQLKELQGAPDAKANLRLAGVKLDRVSGVYQDRIGKQDFHQLHDSSVGRKHNLDRQFQLHRHGDLSRQLNLGPALIQQGGWSHRHHGVVVSSFTQSSFSCWYAGGGYYPTYCWTPRWTPWVDWCWWDSCLPIYDPRPFHCRPIHYNPCPTWVVYDYPVWQPLPVVTCGTWIDVPPVVLDSGTDLQLLATRFVDNGHPDQNLGPRYRVWLRNNGPLSTKVPFNVLLIAGNDLIPSVDLPQAGSIVNGIEAGEVQSVDIRLPLAANRLGVTPEGLRIPFNYLHVLVDSHRELPESNESNNGSVVARNDILPVDPATFSSDVSVGAPGTIINIAGEGFGPEPGQVIVSVNGLQLQAEIHGWYDLGVRIALPNIALAGAIDADLLIIRGDGAAANPLDFDLVPASMMDEASLPPIPSP